MPRAERAKQFMPFDALKGLHDALKLKEYEHEKVQKAELSEEDAKRISNTLLNLKNKSEVSVIYFENGHKKSIHGKVKLDIANKIIVVEGTKINLDDLIDIVLKES